MSLKERGLVFTTTSSNYLMSYILILSNFNLIIFKRTSGESIVFVFLNILIKSWGHDFDCLMTLRYSKKKMWLSKPFGSRNELSNTSNTFKLENLLIGFLFVCIQMECMNHFQENYLLYNYFIFGKKLTFFPNNVFYAYCEHTYENTSKTVFLSYTFKILKMPND